MSTDLVHKGVTVNLLDDLLEHEPVAASRAPETDGLCTAEVAECTCPEFCERDHDNE